MAIYIEEDKEKGGGIFGFGVLLVVLIVIGVAVYYLFFVQPAIISTVAPVQLRSIDELTRAQFDPSRVISSPFFTGLRQFVPEPSLLPAGNAAPFGVF